MRVAVFGGTGFVGSYVTDALADAGHRPVLLVRPGSGSKVRRPDACDQVAGGIGDDEAVARTLEGTDAAVYLIGLLREKPEKGVTFEAMHFEGARRAIDRAAEKGVRRFVLMSANGVKEDGTPYQSTKHRAEEYLKAKGLDWTVIRPSVIFGDPRGRMELATQLKEEMIDMPTPAPLFYDGLLPFGAGRFELSPVHVEDVAAVFVRSVEEPALAGQSICLGGPDTLAWKQIIELIAEACGKRKLMLPAPAWAVKTVAALFEGADWFPVTRDQITMLMEGNTCDATETFRALGITPKAFEPSTLSYLRSS
ncbi:MAG: NAD(P)H-binding protein [Chromatiales bacterium]|jgi:NADH dehydrogenase